MIVQELIGNDLIRTYSDQNVYIHGGVPKGNYIEAVDPVSMSRTYTETDIPIEEDEAAAEEILNILLGGDDT